MNGDPHPSASPQALADVLTRLGYVHPSRSSIRGQQNAPLDQILEWAFALEETRPFLTWLCAAFGDNGGVPEEKSRHRAGWDILSKEEFEAWEDLKAKGFISTDDESDLSPYLFHDDEEDGETLEQIESNIKSLEAELKVAQEQLRLMDMRGEKLQESKESVKRRADRLTAENEVADSKIQQLDLEMSNLSLRLDAAVTEAVESASEVAQIASASSVKPMSTRPTFLFQCGRELEEFHRADEHLTAVFHRQFPDLYPMDAQDAIEQTLPEIFQRPLEATPNQVQLDIPDELRAEITRLQQLYPLTEREFLGSTLKLEYTKAKLDALRRLDMPDEDVQATRAEADTLRKAIEEIISTDLPALWSRIAEFKILSPFLKEYFDSTLKEQTQTTENTDKLIGHLLQQHARQQFLLFALNEEQEAFRKQGHIMEALRQEVAGKKSEIDERLAWMAAQREQIDRKQIPSINDDLLLVNMKKALDLKLESLPFSSSHNKIINQTEITSPASLKQAISQLLQILATAKNSAHQQAIHQLEEQMSELIQSSEGLLSAMYEHATTAKPLLAPKELYDAENRLSVQGRKCTAKMHEAVRIVDDFKESRQS